MRFMMKSEIHRCDPLIFHSYERVRIHHSTTSSRIQITLFVHPRLRNLSRQNHKAMHMNNHPI